MPRYRFVDPDTVTLPLSDGDSVTVKKRLNHGEQHDCFTHMYRAGVNGKAEVDTLKVGDATITAYLVDWTLVDRRGAVIPIPESRSDAEGAARRYAEIVAILRNLEPETWNEIRNAIAQHEKAVEAELAALKKTPAGVSNAPPTLLSVG